MESGPPSSARRRLNAWRRRWGLVNGRSQTQYPWGSKAGSSDPKVWQHDLFRKDRTPYNPREIELFKQAITESKQTAPQTGTKKQP